MTSKTNDGGPAMSKMPARVYIDRDDKDNEQGLWTLVQHCDDAAYIRADIAEQLAEAFAGLIEAVIIDADCDGGGISGYTSARLSDARDTLTLYRKEISHAE